MKLCKSLISLLLICLFLLPGPTGEAAGGERPNIRPVAQSEAPTPPHTQRLLEVRPVRVRFEGYITQIMPQEEGAMWEVAGVQVMVNDTTVIAPEGYAPTVGDWGRITALHRENLPLLAESVAIRLAPIGATAVEFRGVIESMQAQADDIIQLVVSGTTVLKTRNTSVEGELRVGHVAQVIGALQADGVVIASRIAALAPDTAAQLVEFEGTIEEIHETWWLVEGVKVWIAGAQIPRQGHVGLTAEVTGIYRNDGSVDASFILVEDVNPTQEVRLSGQVIAIASETWQIQTPAGAQAIYVGANTFVDESRAPAIIGAHADVLAIQRADQSLLALRIRLSRTG